MIIIPFMKNLFIVLDGIDGSGKGEQMIKLHNYLYVKSKDYRIVSTREPTNGEHGKKIRDILKSEKDPTKNAELLLDLYVKDRKEHTRRTIKPFLNQRNKYGRNIILCDRYYYSTIAFQNAQGIAMEKLIRKNKGFIKPDIAFILDLPPDMGLERVSKRGKKEKFEKLDFMKKVRHAFIEQRELLQDNIKIIDATGSIEEVFNSIKEELDKIL